jgi:hypothetical protein
VTGVVETVVPPVGHADDPAADPVHPTDVTIVAKPVG